MQTSNHARLAVGHELLPRSVASLPALTALLTQLLALLAVLPLAVTIPAQTLSPFQWALLQGVIAAAIGHRLGMAAWWLPIHLVFTPALVATLALALSPLWFCGGFLSLALIYGKTDQTQVPLYLSSRAAAQALASLLPARHGFAFMDPGSECGGLLHYLRWVRPDGNCHRVVPEMCLKLDNFEGPTLQVWRM